LYISYNIPFKTNKFLIAQIGMMILLVLLITSGCGAQATAIDITNIAADTVKKVSDDTNDTVNKSVDKAINSLDITSADWQKVGRELQQNLNKDAIDRIDQTSKEAKDRIDQTSKEAGNRLDQASKEAKDRIDQVSKESKERIDQISRETNLLLNRGIAQTGSEIRCDADFMRVRIKQGLEEIKNVLILKKAAAALRPSFCQVVPRELDLRIEPQNRPANVEFYGYDFFDDRYVSSNKSPLIKASLKGSNGSTNEDMTRYLALTSHYLLTFKIAEFQTDFYCKNKDQKIVLETLDGKFLGELNIICPVAPTPTPTPTVTPTPSPTPTPVPLPDLTIINYQVNPLNLQVGQLVSAKVLIKNQGAGPAGAFIVTWIVNPSNGSRQDKNIPGGLSAGQELWVDFVPQSYNQPGNVDVSFTLDPNNKIQEINEGNNNTAPIRLTIRPQPPPPDMFVKVIGNVELFVHDDDTFGSDEKLCRGDINLRLRYSPVIENRSWELVCKTDDGYGQIFVTIKSLPNGFVEINGNIIIDMDGSGQKKQPIYFTVSNQTAPSTVTTSDGDGSYSTARFFNMRLER